MAVLTVIDMYHPWRKLRGQDHITVHWRMMPDGLQGASDGTSQIWLDRRLLQVERRCALVHEMIHIEHGHADCQPERIERTVRREAAERLIDIARLIDAAKWAYSVEEMADELWVTPQVLRDRVEHLSPIERRLVDAAILKARDHDAH